jgi:hypothetical protein
MTFAFRLCLVLLTSSSALACSDGNSSDDSASGGAGSPAGGTQSGASGGTESSGGTGTSGSGGAVEGSGGGSGTTGDGGSPDPDQKPNPVDLYPCYGESRVYDVSSAGEAVATPKKVTLTYFDQAGRTLKLLVDDDADGSIDTGSYYKYDSDGTLSYFDYDNNGDDEIDSRAEYTYDGNGDLRFIDYFSPPGTLVLRYTLDYDDQRRRNKVNQFRASDDLEIGTETYVWSSDWEYDYTSVSSGKLDEVSHVVLNEYGDISSKEIWADEAKTEWVSKTTISYDDLGRPLREEVETKAAMRVTESTYGERGLVIEQSVRDDDKLVEVAKYEYFDQCME